MCRCITCAGVAGLVSLCDILGILCNCVVVLQKLINFILHYIADMDIPIKR
jgi:hypothetical protein